MSEFIRKITICSETSNQKQSLRKYTTGLDNNEPVVTDIKHYLDTSRTKSSVPWSDHQQFFSLWLHESEKPEQMFIFWDIFLIKVLKKKP